MKRIITLIASVMMLSGCLPHTELDRLGIAEAVGVDYSDGKYTVTVQYFNTDSSGGVTAVDSSAPNAVTVRGEGRTIESALRSVSYTSGREMTLGAASAIIFGESALFTLKDALRLASSHYSGNLRALIAAARGKAEDIINVRFSEGSASVEKLTDILNNAEKLGLSRPIQLYEVQEKLCGRTSSAVLPLLEAYPADTDATEDGMSVRIAGGALYADGGFAGELDAQEMSGLCMLDPRPGSDRSCELALTYHGDEVRMLLANITPRISASLDGESLLLDIEMICDCRIVSAAMPDPESSYPALRLLCEKEIRTRIERILEKTAGKGSDVMQLEYSIHACSPSVWREIKDDFGRVSEIHLLPIVRFSA